MKKNIIKSNGTSKLMGIEEVLKENAPMIKKMVYHYFGQTRDYEMNKEDYFQEGNIALYNAFITYNEIHCFSTHLMWQLKKRFHIVMHSLQAKIRNSEDFTFIRIDEKLDGKDGSNMTIHELLEDENALFENEIVSNDLLDFISKNIKENEVLYLKLNIGLFDHKSLAKHLNRTKQAVYYKNDRFKSKLEKLIIKYNEEII